MTKCQAQRHRDKALDPEGDIEPDTLSSFVIGDIALPPLRHR